MFIFTFQTTQLFTSCIFDFYSILLHIPAAYFSDRQCEYWLTKRVKGERPLLTNSGYKIIVTFIIIILKKEKLVTFKLIDGVCC